MAKKRNRIELIYSILSIIKENKNSIRPTPLLRYSNLSSQRFSEYIKELMLKGFIKDIKDANGKKYYSLADRGFRFLEKYHTIRGFIEDFDL